MNTIERLLLTIAATSSAGHDGMCPKMQSYCREHDYADCPWAYARKLLNLSHDSAADRYQRDSALEALRHAREGRPEFVFRCGCYRGGSGHSPNSGRCTATNFYAPLGVRVCQTCRGKCEGQS